ncbi:ATP-binding protein [Uliginosibacterium sp. TH139]|uniref:sensor histidine kinase n=1 Tax=Uliginosibacterium sp. TH139 TaxID=2067453 RepID=UPI000C7D016D|nr:ATP-binding protein [Uliginosibacterium sp. TH139]PLK49654.1 histidine kinase [Uliginosibacterium sp. TH139]
MRLPYPLSLPKLLLLGFVLVALPAVLALFGAYFSLAQLSQRSESAITRATTITRDSRALSEHLTALERLARQQLVLGDEAGLGTYARQRTAFNETAERLQRHADTLDLGSNLDALRLAEKSIWQSLQPAELSQNRGPALLKAFAAMNDSASLIINQADARIEADIQSLRIEAAAARRQLLQRLWILIPISLLLALGITALIRRPFRQIEEAMRGLGEGRFDTPIRVTGPRDMALLGQRLDWLRTRLQALDAQKTRLLHHVSHELKTPLTALHEGTALLLDKVTGPLNTEQLEVVQILASNCQRLRKLIENLLDYSGLRFAPGDLRREQIALTELIALLIADHKLAAAARNIRIACEGDALNLQADRENLRVILDNLLSNALKYAPPGSSVLIRSSAGAGQICIEVCDEGPGIPLELAPGMFEAFVQGPAPQGSPVKGSGLGLSIVHELVALHGGEVSLHPNSPQGTRACVRLPLTGSPA